MRVLITGASGYIGTRVMETLASRAQVEEILDVDIKPPTRPIAKVRHVERSVTADLRDLFRDPSRRIDVAMHLAWTVDALRDAAVQRAICIGGCNRFLDGCVAGDVRHVVFMSSATAYGANPAHADPVDESEPLKDKYHFQYSAEKREAESLFRRFEADRPGTLLQIVRPCIVGGPNMSNFIIRSMDKPFIPRALGHNPYFQLVHEDDCAAAVVAIVESRLPGAVNIAADGLLRLSDVAGQAGVPLVPLPLPLVLAIAATAWRRGLSSITEAPPGYVYFTVYPWLVSNRRLQQEVGFKLTYTAAETLALMLRSRPPRQRFWRR